MSFLFYKITLCEQFWESLWRISLIWYKVVSSEVITRSGSHGKLGFLDTTVLAVVTNLRNCIIILFQLILFASYYIYSVL